MTIAFLGDSITLGYALEDKSKRYATLVSQRLGMEEENYGITGTLVAKAGLNTDDGKDFLTRASLIDGADVAVVFGGTNDYFWSDKPIYGEGDCFFATALKKIIDRVKEKREGKITLFVTPYPHEGIGNYLGGEHWRTNKSRHLTSEKNFNGQTLKDYVDVTERLCAENGIPCLNLHKDFDFKWQEHTVDGCHPNDVGHVLLADAITEKLKELINAKNME